MHSLLDTISNLLITLRSKRLFSDNAPELRDDAKDSFSLAPVLESFNAYRKSVHRVAPNAPLCIHSNKIPHHTLTGKAGLFQPCHIQKGGASQ